MIRNSHPDPMSLGFDVLITRDFPKYQLPTDMSFPPGFREEFNAWARNFFGTTCTIEDGRFYQTGSTLIMNARTYASIRNTLGRHWIVDGAAIISEIM